MGSLQFQKRTTFILDLLAPMLHERQHAMGWIKKEKGPIRGQKQIYAPMFIPCHRETPGKRIQGPVRRRLGAACRGTARLVCRPRDDLEQ